MRDERLLGLPQRPLSLLVLVGLLASCGACRQRDLPAEPAKPNVLVVVIDTLRADRLSQYGYDLPTCTRLDSFTVDATRFGNAYAVSPRTGPSTASLFTGLSPGSHGVTETGDKLATELETLAERLRREGWATVGFSHNAVVSRTTGFGQGFDEFVDYRGRLRAYPDVSKMVEGADGWLRNRDDRPFFIYLHAMNVHGPYSVPTEHKGDLLGRPPRDGFEFYGPVMVRLMEQKEPGARDQVGSEMLTSLNEQYDTAVRYTCDQIALILDQLRSLGLYDDTLVVFLADHGEELFDHGGFGHGYTLHREVLQVPLWIKLPGQRQGREIEAYASIMDIHPTLLDLLGLEATRTFHGRSLASLLRGEVGALDGRALYFQESSKRMSGQALLTDTYKLVRIERDYRRDRPVAQLFDKRNDPLERRDVAADHPEVVEEMSRRLDLIAERLQSPEGLEATNVLDELELEALRSLGYVE